MKYLLLLLTLVLFLIGCSEEPTGREADMIGIAGECAVDDDCRENEDLGELTCLLDFTNGYCGLSECTNNESCPDGSICVAHSDGVNYCFRECTDKVECNVNRSPDSEANCSANFDLADTEDIDDSKACIPPSS